MTTILSLHDGDAPDNSLLGHLADAAENADRGGGIFGWTNRRGLDLVFAEPRLAAFFQRGPFQLVVGVDTITDVPALDRLAELMAEHPEVTARVLYQADPKAPMFHPKLAWFVTGSNLRLIVGSGNLTGGGLQRNWEACTVVDLDGAHAIELEDQLSSWIAAHEDLLRGIDDEEVRARAATNLGKERWFKRMRPRIEASVHVPDDAAVFVTEIGGGRRWTQADVTKRYLEDYFGFTGELLEFPLVYVELDGTVTGPHLGTGNNKANSSNWWVELKGVTGDYPDVGRPVVVFLALEEGGYRYCLVRPDDDEHGIVDAILHASPTQAPRHRRLVQTAAELRAAWPSCPVLNAI